MSPKIEGSYGLMGKKASWTVERSSDKAAMALHREIKKTVEEFHDEDTDDSD